MREKEIHAAVAVFLGESGLFGSKESKCCDSNTTAGCRQRRSFQGLPARASAPKSGESDFKPGQAGKVRAARSASAGSRLLAVGLAPGLDQSDRGIEYGIAPPP